MIPTTAVECFSVIIGIAMGALYALGGWSSKPGNPDVLESSMRYKNLKFVLSGGILNTGVGALTWESSDQMRLLAFYSGSVVIVTGIIFFIVGISIFSSYKKLSKKYPHSDALLNASPVTEYIYYGLHHSQSSLEKSARAAAGESLFRLQNTFLPLYLENLTTAITTIAVGNATVDVQTRKRFVSLLLESMRAVVLTRLHSSSGATVNVNYMICIPSNDTPTNLLGKLRFQFGDITRYKCFLALKDYAKNDGTEDFILPVEDTGYPNYDAMLLPGAPTAYAKKAPDIIDRTESIKYPSAIEARVVQDMKDYFARKNFKSFASIPFAGANSEVLGIVNVECSEEYVFGRTDEEKKHVALLLYPFCFMLSYVIR